MASVLVPVGRHFLTPAYLERLAATIPTDAKAEVIGKAAIDNEGARIAVIFTPKGDHFVARTAFGYEWADGLHFGADLTFKF